MRIDGVEVLIPKGMADPEFTIAPVDVRDKIVFVGFNDSEINYDHRRHLEQELQEKIVEQGGAKACLLFVGAKVTVATTDKIKEATLNDFMKELKNL
jgi:hypothetical protein